MSIFKTITNPDYSPITFAVATVIPIFFGLLVLSPPLALAVLTITAVITCRRVRAGRRRKAAALAARKNTWGF